MTTTGRYTLVALHPTRRILHFYATPEGIKHIYSNDETLYWRDSSIVWAGYTNPHTDTSDAVDNNPSAMYTANGRTFLCWTNGTNVYMKYSDDLGETWSEASVVLSGYEHAFFWMDGHLASPIINAVAVDSSGNVVYTYSADGGSTFSNVVTVTTGAESAQPSGFTTINGFMMGRDVFSDDVVL